MLDAKILKHFEKRFDKGRKELLSRVNRSNQLTFNDMSKTLGFKEFDLESELSAFLYKISEAHFDGTNIQYNDEFIFEAILDALQELPSKLSRMSLDQIKFLFNPNYVIADGKRFYVKGDTLTIQGKNIVDMSQIKGLQYQQDLDHLIIWMTSITEINGLEPLVNLKELDIYVNQITEIKGLDTLRNLTSLNIEMNNIAEIKGLENLVNLKCLILNENPIPVLKGLEYLDKLEQLGLKNTKIQKELIIQLGGAKFNGRVLYPQKFVEYCRQKSPPVKKRTEFQKQELAEYIKKLPLMYEKITFNEIMERYPINLVEIKAIIEDLIIKGELNAKFQENTISFKKVKEAKEKKEKSKKDSSDKVPEFKPKEIKISRGGDWKIEGNQSVFFYKVKVKNESKFLVGNIQIIMTSIPRGLNVEDTRYRIESLKPGSHESPTFKLMATDSCVGDTIEGIVIYTDPSGAQQTKSIKPFEICYVCNLLTPKQISKEEFDEKIDFMEEKKLVIDSSLNLADLEEQISAIVKNCHFALIEELKGTQSESFRKIEAFAQGLYDKQDVALSIAVKQMDEGSQLVVKAMSDRGEKVTDLLRDLSSKMDDIKSDTELIKEYTSQIEEIFNRIDDLEGFLIDNLGSDFTKLKYTWDEYKSGKIGKKELIKEGIKVIGKKFLKAFLGKVL